MNLGEGFTQSFETIRHNKLRTFLTMLGMNIGVASVIAVMAIGLMGRGAIMKGIESIGSNLLWVQPNSQIYPQGVMQQLMRPDDLDVMSGLVGDAWMSPILRASFVVGYRGDQSPSTIYGVWATYQSIWDYTTAAGRFLTQRDGDQRRRVVVLGWNTSAEFFPSAQDALGAQVNLAGKDFTVIGVMPKTTRSAISDGSDDDTCFVPYEVLQSVMDWSAFGGPRISRIYVKVKQIADVDFVSSQIDQYLTRQYGDYQGNPRFLVRKSEQSIQTTNKVFDIITTVITLIAAISLVVGGIGIMNIMLVTVTERTKEIGIRKAIGAKRRDILAQFLIESIIVCLIGGGIGILLGVLITALVSLAQHWDYLLPWFAILIGLAVSIGIGLFFGIYPAMKASRLDPVVALTKE